DAILGNDKKFTDDVIQAAESLKPAFIALVSSPIPFMNGTDFKGLARLIEKKTGIPAFFIETNGMHDYSVGAGRALEEIVKRYVKPPEKKMNAEPEAANWNKRKEENSFDASDGSRKVNIMGMTPLDFAAEGSVSSIRKILENHGWQIISCYAMGDSLEDLKKAGEADVSLVVSSVGLRAAKVLEERYGIPWVAGTPVKGFEDVVLEKLEKAAETGCSMLAYDMEVSSKNSGCTEDSLKISDYLENPRREYEGEAEKKTVTLIGEPVIMESIAASIRRRTGMKTCVLCPLEQTEELLLIRNHEREETADCLIHGEEEAEQFLMKAEYIVADPLYRPICNPVARFYPLPHLAFSGRCFIKKMVNLIEEDYCEWLKS
ncbi:MAG: nitrogenase component 1, partial [Lachnospiraceae bacterium]|nr:nitrogenase component 1 [Lachnospiraceae bacterium]